MKFFQVFLILAAIFIDNSIQETPVTKATTADAKLTPANELSSSSSSSSQTNANAKTSVATPVAPASDSTDEDPKDDAAPDVVVKKTSTAADSSNDHAAAVESPAEPKPEQQQPEHIHESNKKCPNILCKNVPSDAVCKPVPENPAVAILGPLGDCCPFFICFRKDGSFFAHFAGLDMERTQMTPTNIIGLGQSVQALKMTPPFTHPGVTQNRFAEFSSVSTGTPFGASVVNPNNNKDSLAFLVPQYQSNFMARRMGPPFGMQMQHQHQMMIPPLQDPKPQSFQQYQEQSHTHQNVVDRSGSLFPNWNDGFRDRRNIRPQQPMLFNRNPLLNPFLQPGFPEVFQPFLPPRQLQPF